MKPLRDIILENIPCVTPESLDRCVKELEEREKEVAIKFSHHRNYSVAFNYASYQLSDDYDEWIKTNF